MIVINPENTNHEIIIIPRFYPSDDIVFSLYNEATQQTENVEATYVVTDGNMFVSFDYNFTENQNFQLKITESSNVVYRDKIFTTSQNPQDFKLTNNVYFT